MQRPDPDAPLGSWRRTYVLVILNALFWMALLFWLGRTFVRGQV